MFDASQLIEKLQAHLGDGYVLYDDYGKYQEAARNGNTLSDVVNGIYRMSPLDIRPMQGLFVATSTAEIELIPSPEQLNLTKEKIIDISELYNGKNEIITNEGYSYTVRYAYSTAFVQSEIQAPNGLGRVTPIIFTVSYTIFENGIYGDDIEVYIDGEQIYYTSAVSTRIRVSSTYPTTDNGTLKGINIQNGFGIDLVAPFYKSNVGSKLYNSVTNSDDGKAKCLTIKNPDGENSYIAEFGQTSCTSQLGQNVGFNVSLVEADADIINYNAAWDVVITTETYYTMTIADSVKRIVFWGDGTTETVIGSAVHIYTDSLTSHEIRRFYTQQNDYRDIRTYDNLNGLEIYIKTSADDVGPEFGGDDYLPILTTDYGDIAISWLQEGKIVIIQDEVASIPINAGSIFDDGGDTFKIPYLSTENKSFVKTIPLQDLGYEVAIDIQAKICDVGV